MAACGRASSSAGWGWFLGDRHPAPQWPPCWGGATSPVTVELDGGELQVDVSPDLDVTLTGWAEPVFRGEFSDEFVAELERAS